MILINRNLNRTIWQKRIDTQAASDLSQKAWCIENDINIHNFIYWKKRLGETVAQDKKQQQFIALSPNPKICVAPIILKIGAASIEVHENFNSSLLDDLVSILIRYA